MGESFQCGGFQAAGVAAGIKSNQDLDLGVLFIPESAAAAAVFTRNQVQAAPVQLSKSRLAGARARAVIVNSGNANCCTGERGLADAQTMVEATAQGLDIDADEVWVASTGVIGAPLPMERILEAVPKALEDLRTDGFVDFARAIMTTDTLPKLVRSTGQLDGGEYTLLAVAKGVGMLRPDMATMLCFICTDADISPALLQHSLTSAVERSLNRISVDGDTSTNDMALAMASGTSGVRVESAEQVEAFGRSLQELLVEVARLLVKDGEGATKVVEIKVRGAESDQAAFQVADTVAHSPLVKTAFYGEDANWGRIIAAVGRSGVAIVADAVDLYFDDIRIFHHGLPGNAEAEALATQVLKQPEFCVTIDLNQGTGEATILTCDFSTDYVRINADYRS